MEIIEVCTLESMFPVRYASRTEQLVAKGTTLEDLAPSNLSGSWACILDGKTVRPKDWESYTVRSGSQVIFTPMPEDISGFALEVLKYVIIGVGTSFVASKIFGVPEIETFDADTPSPTYSFNNLNQTADAGLPIKIVYGRHPVAGNVLELDLIGNNPSTSGNPYGSSLDMTIGLCEGEISAINSVSINGNDLASYTTLATQSSNLGTSSQEALGSDGTTSTQTVGVDLIPATAINVGVYRLQENNNANSAGTRWSNGLPVIGSTVTGSGGLSGTATVWDAFTSFSTQKDYVEIYNASEGSNLTSAHGSSSGTTVIGTITGLNSSGQTTTLGVTYASGNPTQQQVGVEVGQVAEYTTTSEVDKVRLNIQFPQGLYFSNSNGIQTRSVQIRYRYRNTAEVDSNGDPLVAWSGYFYETVTSDQVGVFLYSINVTMAAPGNLPAKGTYLFEINHNSVDADEDGYRTRVDSVVEIQNQVYAYPNLATLRLLINADSSINGSSIPNIIADVTGRKIQKWDGVSTSTPVFIDAAPYDNPAWIVYDLLTNDRYGLGNWIDTDNISLPDFKAWADWCDELVDDGQGGSEPRATWNGVVDGSQSAWEVALSICGTARATLYTAGETIKVKYEHERTPTQLFNMANIVEGSWNQSYASRAERPTRVDAQILNADNNYQVDVIGVDDPDAIAASLPQRVLRVELPGVTRESQAAREARFRLNIDKLGEVCAWESEIDAVACEPGDLVLVQHDVPSWGSGGRVTAGTSTTVTLDNDITLDAGVSYQIMVRHPDDSRETKTITSNAGSYTAGTALTVDSAWTTTPALHDLYAVGPYETYAKKVVVTSITTTGELNRKLEGVVYTPEIHQDDIVTATSAFRSLLDPDTPPSAVTNLAVTELKTERVQAAISWQYPEETAIGSAIVWTKSSGTSEYRVLRTVDWPTTQVIVPFDVDPLAPVTSDIVVTAVSPSGAHLSPATQAAVSFTPSGIRTIPSPPTTPTLIQDDDLLEIAWTAPTNAPIARYEIRRGRDWVGSIPVGFSQEPRIVTDQWTPTLSSGLTEKYFIRAISRDGLYGSVVVAEESNTLGAWTGGTTQTKDFNDTGNWGGNSLSNLTVFNTGTGRVLEITETGTQAKLETAAYDAGALGSYRIGILAHSQFEDDIWQDAKYAWQSREGIRRSWSGTIDPNQWETAVDLQFATRTSSSGSWTAWRPLTTRKVATQFREIKVRIVFTPAESNQAITLHNLILILEAV